MKLLSFFGLLSLFVVLILSTPAMAQTSQISDTVKTWVTTAAEDIMTFNGQNAQDRLKENEKYFTETGFNKFSDAIYKSRMISWAKENNILVIPTAVTPPKIISYEDLGDIKEVKVQLDLDLTFQSSSKTRTSPSTVEILLLKTEQSKNWLIEQWILSYKKTK